MVATLCLFEDEASIGFYPVSETRHVSELLVGCHTLCDRARTLFPEHEVLLAGRPEIIEHASEEDRLAVERVDGPILFLNARLLPNQSFRIQMPEEEGWIVRAGSTVIAASIPPRQVPQLFASTWIPDFDQLDGIPEIEMHGLHIYSWIWDLLSDNNVRIAEDGIEFLSRSREKTPEGVSLLNPASIAIDPGASIGPGVVLDATEGPVIIDSGVTVMSGSIVIGPCYIGPNSTVKAGARIYGGTSIGPWSKIGGEVENSIIIGYSNKQHEGFLGHSYLGSWVNIGADTNTSDLKNNYGEIRVEFPSGPVDTGRMMLGTLMGDHSKTGINTMLNTGTVVGVFANVFGSGFPPKSIPSFYWGGADGGVDYRFDAAMVVAERVMARRNVSLTPEDRTLLRRIHDRTDRP